MQTLDPATLVSAMRLRPLARAMIAAVLADAPAARQDVIRRALAVDGGGPLADEFARAWRCWSQARATAYRLEHDRHASAALQAARWLEAVAGHSIMPEAVRAELKERRERDNIAGLRAKWTDAPA